MRVVHGVVGVVIVVVVLFVSVGGVAVRVVHVKVVVDGGVGARCCCLFGCPYWCC